MLDTGDGFFLLKSRSVSRLDEILFMLNTHNVYSLGKPFGLMTTFNTKSSAQADKNGLLDCFLWPFPLISSLNS